MSQFASDNNVYFEFYPKYCLVSDILTREILLRVMQSKGYTSSILWIPEILKLRKGVVIFLKLLKRKGVEVILM